MRLFIRIILSIHAVILLASAIVVPVMAQSTKTTAASADAVQYSQAELDQMLAPIALYPDSVLSHLLIAATYPLEVVMADRWAKNNSRKTGDDAINAVDDKEWDASVKALVAFPTVLERLSHDLDWTESIGEAFLSDEERVLETIQNLRQRAYDEGSLDSLDHLRVTNEDDDIVIEPAHREVVYIPVYNTRIVYGPWWWNDYPPIYWHHDDFYHRRSHVVYWGPSVYLSHSFFFGGFHWRNHHVVVVDSRYRHRYRNYYYSNRHLTRYQHSRRWQHDRHHRRGVEYKNPRTRDYFERRDRDTRTMNTRRERAARQVENRLRRNERMENSRNQSMDTRSIKREERSRRDRARGDRSREERSDSRRINNSEQRRQNNTRSIRKERAVNDSRQNRSARDERRAREVGARESSGSRDRSTRKEVRAERAVESNRRERTEKRIDTRAIKYSERANRRSESRTRSVKRDRSSSERPRRQSGQRSVRDRRFQ
ncbi:MAG: DUF3300 domain-containing protein [Cellvibrionaceae bacterium]